MPPKQKQEPTPELEKITPPETLVFSLAPIADPRPRPRFNHSAFLQDGCLTVFGGVSEDGITHHKDVWRYSIAEKVWKMVDTSGTHHPGTSQSSATCVLGQGLFFGGWSGVRRNHTVSILTSPFLDPTPTWSELASSGGVQPPSVSFHASCGVGSKLFVIGGCGANGPTADIHTFDLDTKAWQVFPVPANSLKKRSSHSAASIGDKIFVFGGRNEDGKVISELQVMDVEHSVWITPKVEGLPPPPRQNHVAVVVETKMILLGGIGMNGTVVDDVCMLETAPNQNGSMTWLWPKVEGKGPGGRQGHTAVASGSYVFVFGGKSDDLSGVSNDLFVLDLTSMYPEDTGIESNSAPTGRNTQGGTTNPSVRPSPAPN
eukprot:PhF_6_TR38729/c0_g1_i1/m.57973/K20285/RABEPK; Rab9 effector protein with kelch motifs